MTFLRAEMIFRLPHDLPENYNWEILEEIRPRDNAAAEGLKNSA